MKRCVSSLFGIMIFLIANPSVVFGEDIVAAARALESRGEYRFAAQLLIRNLNEEYSDGNCQLLLDFNQRVLSELSSEITRTSVSEFAPPEKDGFLKRNKDNWKRTATSYVIDVGLAILKFPPYKSVKEQYDLNKEDAEKQRAAVRAMENELLDLEKIRLVLENYETVKSVVRDLEKTLAAKLMKDPDTMDSTLRLLNVVRSQKKTLKSDRTKFLSYVVISPYLWEAERQMFLADSDYLAWIGKDKERLDCAVDFLAKACHMEWLYQSSEDVRKQFVAAQRKLKEIASKVEFEDYKVVTTLSDCLDPSKKRGADAWME